MKTRIGFVSNSSSSSFVIPRNKLSEEQIRMIYDHDKLADNDPWDILVDENEVSGDTYMDNFDMEDYLVNHVKVNPDDIKWWA